MNEAQRTQSVELMKKGYQSGKITKEKIDFLLENKKIDAEQYMYIVGIEVK